MLYLFFGYSVIWLGIFLYLLQLSQRQQKLERELRMLEESQRVNS